MNVRREQPVQMLCSKSELLEIQKEDRHNQKLISRGVGRGEDSAEVGGGGRGGHRKKSGYHGCKAIGGILAGKGKSSRMNVVNSMLRLQEQERE